MGMTIIQEKIPNIPDELLAVRLVELWNFLFGNIVPYLEGVFEPLSLDDDRVDFFIFFQFFRTQNQFFWKKK